MAFIKLTDLDLAGKRVLIRADLNVPVKDGKVTSDARITASMPVPASRWTAPSSRSCPGTTTSMATPATCCVSPSTSRAKGSGSRAGGHPRSSI